jgi:hypothetical protein
VFKRGKPEEAIAAHETTCDKRGGSDHYSVRPFLNLSFNFSPAVARGFFFMVQSGQE